MANIKYFYKTFRRIPLSALYTATLSKVTWASLRFGKTRENIDSFRGFIDTFTLFLNRSEAVIVTLPFWTCSKFDHRVFISEKYYTIHSMEVDLSNFKKLIARSHESYNDHMAHFNYWNHFFLTLHGALKLTLFSQYTRESFRIDPKDSFSTRQSRLALSLWHLVAGGWKCWTQKLRLYSKKRCYKRITSNFLVEKFANPQRPGAVILMGCGFD